MKHFLYALLASVACMPADATEWRCDADGGVKFTTERVVDLPQDQERWYCSILGHPADPQFQQLCRWFDADAELNRIKRGTHFSVIDTTSLMYRHRYRNSTGLLPCLRVQDSTGKVVYQVSGRNIPLTSEALCNSIRSSCLRRRVQPQPTPRPRPQPVNPDMNIHYHFSSPDDKTPDKEEQPDVFEPSEPQQGSGWVWILVGAGLAAVLTGVAYEWRKSHQE